MRCPACGTEVESEIDYCPSCLGGLPRDRPAAAATDVKQAEPVPGPLQPAAPPAAADANAAPATPFQVCPKHPDFPRAGTCSRCGSFICVRCEPDLATTASPLCVDCRERAQKADRDTRIPQLEREVFWLLVAFGVIVGGLFSLPAIVTGINERALVYLLAGVPTGIGLIGIGVAYRATHRLAIAWGGVVAVLVATAMFLAFVGLGLNLLSLLFLFMPVYLAFKLSSLAELRKAAAAAPPPPEPPKPA